MRPPFLTEADRAVVELPSAAELKGHWDEVNSRLLAGFSNLTASDWAQKHTVVSEKDFAANPLRIRRVAEHRIHLDSRRTCRPRARAPQGARTGVPVAFPNEP